MTNEHTLWPGYALAVDQPVEVVESNMPEPDPEWRFVDSHGHGHFYDPKAKTWPTLEWVILPCTMGHGDDCEAEGFYRCPLCNEQISPGTRPPRPVTIRGPVTYRLTVTKGESITSYAFGPEQFNELTEAIGSAVEEKLADYVTDRAFGRR